MTRLWKLLVIILCLTVSPVHAQAPNLLNNAGFDGALTAGGGGAIPNGWAMWGTAESDKESLSALVRSTPYSWRLRKEHGVFTGGGFQTVSVQPGATYRFSIYALIFTCDDEQYVCRNEQGTFSDTSSGGRVRVGIDPTGGSNPSSNAIVWSGFRSPFTWGTFEYLSVEARASGSQLTVFTYYTADKSMLIHDVFWDDASLVAIAAPPPTQAPVTSAPIETDPEIAGDGAQVHVVRPGENLWAIARAYDVDVEQLMQWNQMADDIIHPGDRIIVRPAPTPTPSPPVINTPTSTPTITVVASSPTVVAVEPTATVEIVEVDSNESDEEDDDLFRSGVVAMAVVVIIIGIVTIGGILMIIGTTLFRSQ